jgi:hypothetical protein
MLCQNTSDAAEVFSLPHYTFGETSQPKPKAYMMNVQTLANSLKTTSRWISPPVSLYAGYNSVTGAGLSTAILGISEQTGADSSMSCTVCTSLQEVIYALGIQQSLSVAYGSVTAVDEKLDFFRNLKLTANNVSIVVYCKHVHSKETA